MLRLRHLALLLSAAFLMNGCVAMDKYNALKLERDQYLERLSQAEAEARTEREKAKLLQDQLNAIMQSGPEQQKLVQSLMQENADLKAKLEDVNRKYEEALRRGPTVVLPEQLNNALAELAKQNPDIMEFDAARGVVKFKGDVTFASGSSELTPKAREVITASRRSSTVAWPESLTCSSPVTPTTWWFPIPRPWRPATRITGSCRLTVPSRLRLRCARTPLPPAAWASPAMPTNALLPPMPRLKARPRIAALKC